MWALYVLYYVQFVVVRMFWTNVYIIEICKLSVTYTIVFNDFLVQETADIKNTIVLFLGSSIRKINTPIGPLAESETMMYNLGASV